MYICIYTLHNDGARKDENNCIADPADYCPHRMQHVLGVLGVDRSFAEARHEYSQGL